MRTTTKTESVNYYAIDAQSVITMAGLMDMLIVNINMQKTMSALEKLGLDRRDVHIEQFNEDMCNASSFDKERVYKTLTEIGFVPSGSVDLMPDGYKFTPDVEECEYAGCNNE